MVRSRVIIGSARLRAARKAYENGEAAHAIAERLGITEKALRARAYRRKWKRKQRPEKTAADARSGLARHGKGSGMSGPAPRDEARARSGQGAPRRKGSVSAAPATSPAAGSPVNATRTPDRLALVRRVRGAVEREIAGAERLLADGGAGDAHVERTARTLASLVRTLRELNALDGAPPADPSDGEPPRDLDEFRRELAARLDRLHAEDAGSAAGEPVGTADRALPD